MRYAHELPVWLRALLCWVSPHKSGVLHRYVQQLGPEGALGPRATAHDLPASIAGQE